MRRKTVSLGLASSVVAVALVAIVYGIGSHGPSDTVDPVEPRSGVANQTRQASLTDAELIEVVPIASMDRYQNPTDTESFWDIPGHMDEDTFRRTVREDATRDVPKSYAPVLERLDITPQEKDALVAFLIETRIANTWTPYQRGESMDQHEWSNRIVAIIGDSKAQQFLALERNIAVYAEVENVRTMLQQKGAPINDTQVDELLKILIEIRDQIETTPPADIQSGSIESLEYQLSQIDERKRLVLELAPSVLSSKQVQHLFERYQALSYRRAEALEIQKNEVADNPKGKRLLWYPAEN